MGRTMTSLTMSRSCRLLRRTAMRAPRWRRSIRRNRSLPQSAVDGRRVLAARDGRRACALCCAFAFVLGTCGPGPLGCRGFAVLFVVDRNRVVTQLVSLV